LGHGAVHGTVNFLTIRNRTVAIKRWITPEVLNWFILVLKLI